MDDVWTAPSTRGLSLAHVVGAIQALEIDYNELGGLLIAQPTTHRCHKPPSIAGDGETPDDRAWRVGTHNVAQIRTSQAVP